MTYIMYDIQVLYVDILYRFLIAAKFYCMNMLLQAMGVHLEIVYQNVVFSLFCLSFIYFLQKQR